MKKFICRDVIPYKIVTDNGGQFISKPFETFCTKHKIILQYLTLVDPQGNGNVEKTNMRMLEGLKKPPNLRQGDQDY